MFEVQELLDFTIDFLHNSTADLKCCALVSVSWLAAAQYHLFSYIELGDDLACKRLGTVLEASPHLLRFIAHLAIEFHPHGDPYVALSKLHFTHLRKLTIYSLPPRWALPVMQNLCALPSILHISLMRPGDPLLFFSFLRHRTAKLKTFEVRGRLYPYGSSEESLVDATFIPHAERRIQVECLEITGVTRVVTECLAAPPFDFTSLKRLVILENLEPLSAERLAGMFVLLGPSLSHVEINGTIADRAESFGKELDISPTVLPHLTHFTMHILSPSALPAMSVLLSKMTPESPLERVTLAVTRDCAPSCGDLSKFAHRDIWEALDAAIASLGSVSLEIKVSLTVYAALVVTL